MGGSTSVADTAAGDAGGVSALSAVVREKEVRRASQGAGEASKMSPSPGGGVERMSAVRRAWGSCGCVAEYFTPSGMLVVPVEAGSRLYSGSGGRCGDELVWSTVRRGVQRVLG